MEPTTLTRSPNQETRRREIVAAAADLVASEGFGACTVRRIADATPLTKSTVHYYFDDANELTDLVVVEVVDRFADACRKAVVDADRAGAVAIFTRIFLGREPSAAIGASLLWHEYGIHSLNQGSRIGLARTYELVSTVFAEAIGSDAQGAALHLYLLGLNFRNRVAPIPDLEIAEAVSALTSTDVQAANLT